MDAEEKYLQRIENENVRKIVKRHPSKSDPSGSWTGLPVDEKEKPVQDADDL
ncbi:MAG: hypothetical protein PHG02_00675 [Oscillospiraceae bacterium]|nr:hypothetical protein [Oscillospiraceae bacterium]